eukprot:TRINITY_DN43648_c0_g1_i1.p1 TRINITY_DN43648_c0_g1~~TRINITY_DN43648_c0_g1_i1.p1  ORF type:complete len:365 (+),score=43.41 TRINITY_DN43648_c0_g1_i1:164-1096(+)
MLAYHPGQGLSAEAIERLRARKKAGVGIICLPKQDTSIQCADLLGGGATKKVRCGICTRPLSHEDTVKGRLVCTCCHLSTSQAHEAPSCVGRHAQGDGVPCVCPTSSIQEASEVTEMTMASPDSCEGIQTSNPLLGETAVDDVMAAVKKGLEGSWEGDYGELYWVYPAGTTSWTCVLEGSDNASPVSFSLQYHERERLVQWGNGKTHFVLASELCHNLDRVVWYPAFGKRTRQTRFVWYRQDRIKGDRSANSIVERMPTKASTISARVSAPRRVVSRALVWSPKLPSIGHASLDSATTKKDDLIEMLNVA